MSFFPIFADMNKANIRASLIIPIVLFIIGLVLNIFIGNFPLEAFKFPVNLILIGELFFMTILLYIFFKKSKIVKYLYSGPAAISSISLYVALVIIMVMIPQMESNNDLINKIGFNNITAHWIFAFSTAYILICVGLITIKRLLPLNTRNIFFFINHFGLWLVLASASLGNADKSQLNITVPEGELIWYGYDMNGEYTEPDFALKLNKFNIEFYQPKLAIVTDNGEMLSPKEFQPTELKENLSITYNDIEIKLITLFENAIAKEDTAFLVAGMPEKTYVAKLLVNSDTIYVQNSTNFHPPVIANIEKDINLAILNPEPKYFGSEIELYTRNGVSAEPHTIEVNKPLRISNWTIYQTSYFKSPEYDGYISVFTAVFDPWLKVVYSGLILTFVGAIYLIFSRKKVKIEAE